MTIENKSAFQVEHIQIDEHGERMRVKLVNEHEHRMLSAWNGQVMVQTLWMSAERKRELGL